MIETCCIYLKKAFSILILNRSASPDTVRLSLCLACALVAIVQCQSYGQDYLLRRSDSSYCYSRQMSGGEQGLRLLGLPESLEKNRGLMNRSLGGISGSSFQTEEATPDQTLRQQAKAAPEPVFRAALSPSGTEHRFDSPFEENESLLRSFERQFATPSYFNVDESSEFPPSKSLDLLGRSHKRGLLKDIVPLLEPAH
jgi:hypothetical protein